ncbi:SDR family NAD(P)-dependent oxidoreductase [Mucilaginibacter sp.]|jgi:short-subunit dehydrogenase|uniref:SDR family NAD(P)-dependent oxidoreductase n=1 Tax=Mucilaginibacter sp. TaxID=1882438 RepID=UPI00356A1473
MNTTPATKIIIIGASSGIGKELTLQLVRGNHVVGITGRRVDLLEELKCKYPDKIFYAQMDNTDLDSVDSNLEYLKKRLDGLDLLILCSGVGNLNETVDFVLEQQTIELNVTAFTKIANWTVKCFEKQSSGHFVAITSLAGMISSDVAPAYNASKAFQINYLKGLRSKLKKSNSPINITDVRPGFVDTAMAKGEGLFWVAPVNKAAYQIIAAINKKKTLVYITKRWAIIAYIFRLINK